MKIDKEVVIDYLKSIFQAIVVFVVLYFFFWPMRIDGVSMEPELYNNERVIMSRVVKYVAPIEKGDVVICKNKEDGPKHIVKRVIAAPGDNIIIKNGEIYIDGEQIEDEFSKGITYGDMNIKLKDWEYFIVGDNREESYDSRHYGAISRENIVGKVILKWFPINKFKIY